MRDDELLELCKEVFKRTGWTGDGRSWSESMGVVRTVAYQFQDDIKSHICPLYTSDYILGKLPRHIVKKRIYHLTIMNGNDRDDNWIADYFSLTADDWFFAGIKEAKDTESDSVLKALLKLVIALHDSGQLDTKTPKEFS